MPSATSPPAPGTTTQPGDADGGDRPIDAAAPPELVVSSRAGTDSWRAFSYCFDSTPADDGSVAAACADGMPTAEGRVPVRTPIEFRFPLEDWRLSAELWNDTTGSDTRSLKLDPAGTGRWVIEEPLPPGLHLIVISGTGPQGDATWGVPVTVIGGLADGP